MLLLQTPNPLELDTTTAHPPWRSPWRILAGHIVAYSAETDTYLVAYSGSEPVIAWEQALGIWMFLRGKPGWESP